MNGKLAGVLTLLTIAMVVCLFELNGPHLRAASWLDASRPIPWNKSGVSIPAAPGVQGAVDLRCHQLARPAALEEDARVRDQGWDLVGAYQGGWQVVVIRGTASYDGMCRPRQYQAFVFVRGAFAGTLSPAAMDSRTDAALSDVILQSDRRLTAQYLRYTVNDPLCCPSRTTRVEYDITEGGVVQPAFASTSSKR